MLSFCTSSIAWYQVNYEGKKKLQKFLRGCLANIQRHNTACSQNVKHLSLLASCLFFISFVFFISLVSWVGRELIIVMLAQKKKKKDKHMHSITTKFSSFSLHFIRDYILTFTVGSIKMWNKQTWKCYLVHWLLVSRVCLFFLSTRHASLLN